jgi:signal transduction histidine kinase
MAKILVVDDRATNREFLVAVLAYSHRVLEAGEGVRGLEIARAEKPDLIIVDIEMASMDGYDFVRALRSDPEIVQTPIIFYTASYLESEVSNLADICGVRSIITKPAEPEEILQKVNAVLAFPRKATAASPDQEFDREHLRVVTNKLSEKVEELDALNVDREKRAKARTAELAQNAQLRELNRRKDEMVAIVSHDLRSPLTGLLVVSQLLKKKKPGGQLVHRPDLLDMVEAATRGMIALVNNLLDVARLRTAQIQLELEAARVSEVIADSLESLKVIAQAKQVVIETEVASEEPLLHVDRSKLSQVFNNLLGNAIKFTTVGGKVSIRIESIPGGVNVRITDTGLGIPAAELPFVFEKFRQTSTCSTAGEVGSGLGLSIVKELVELHGGRVEVDSELNRGTTFRVFLPKSGNFGREAA